MQPPQYGAPQYQQQGYGQPPPPQQQGGYMPAPAPPPAYDPAKKGFFAGLFDFSFSTFITTSIVKFIFGLQLIGIVLGFIGAEISGIIGMVNGAVLQGLLMMIAAPFFAFFGVVLARVYMELIIVIFRIVENLTEINQKTK